MNQQVAEMSAELRSIYKQIKLNEELSNSLRENLQHVVDATKLLRKRKGQLKVRIRIARKKP